MQKNKIAIYLFSLIKFSVAVGLEPILAVTGREKGNTQVATLSINKLTKKWINCFLNVLSAQNLTSGASLNKKKPQN